MIELAKESKDIKEFENKVNEDDAGFTTDLLQKLFNLIKKMLPQQKYIERVETLTADLLLQDSEKD